MPKKNVLFFVHGVGMHKEGWSQQEQDGPEAALVGASGYYEKTFPSGDQGANPLSNSCTFIEIRYDHIFEQLRANWNELSSSLVDENFPGATPEAVGKISADFADWTAPDNWLATHALDAAIYKAFPLVRQTVRHCVASQLAAGVVAHPGEPGDTPRYSIVAHSLGTAVTQDAIQLLGTTNWMKFANVVPGGVTEADLRNYRDRFGNNPFAPEYFKWQLVCMIANVGRIFCAPLPGSPDTILKPSRSKLPGHNAARYYYNFSHALDPVALAGKFSAASSWPRSVAEGFALDKLDLAHFHDKNIHGFAHYLKHPYVHARILRRVVPDRFKDQQVAAALARLESGGDFSRFGPALADDDLRERYLDSLAPILAQAGGSDNGLKRLTDSFNSFADLL